MKIEAMGSNPLNSSKKIKATSASLNLTSEEGFLLSRLQGEMSIKDLQSLCPWPEEHFKQIIEGLQKKSAIDFVKEIEAPSPESVLKILNEEESNPDVAELSREFRRAALILLDNIDQKSPYDILDLHRHSTTHDIKVQYLALSKKFHPDRFFRKQLGPYKQRLDLIFTWIQRAYALLKDPHEREKIDRMREFKDGQKSKSKDQILKSIRNIDPNIERVGKAERYFQQGQESERARDYLNAYNSYALAYQLNPERLNFQDAMEAIRPMMMKQKAVQKLEEAKAAFQLSCSDDCLKLCDEALKMNPDLPEAQVLWARVIIDTRKLDEFPSARERLLRARAMMSKSAEAPFLLGKIALMLGDKKSAKKEFEEALKRDPQHPSAKKLLEDL